jgi:hypothetical protein
MKSMKDFLNSRKPLPEVVEEEVITIEELEAMDEALMEGDEVKSHPMDPPAILIMRRKSIRQFPNNQRVAMYYVDKINKYVTVPYVAMQWSASMPEEVSGNIINSLENIVETQKEKFVQFDDGKTLRVDEQTAKNILKVYSALNEDNKQKLAEMAQTNKENFVKVSNFAQQELLK